MVANPKHMLDDVPMEEDHLRELEAELGDVLDVLTQQIGPSIEALYDRIAGSPQSSESLYRLAHAILLAAYERKGIEGAGQLRDLRYVEHANLKSDPEARVNLLREMRRLNGVRPSTRELVSEYLQRPQDPEVTLTDEQLEEDLVELRRARRGGREE